MTALTGTLNGYQVKSIIQHANCATVVVERDEGDYVVATWWPELGSGWSWGHYGLRDADAVDAVLREVTARNARR